MAGTAEAAAAQADSVLATIRQIWIDLLGVPDIGVDDDFFDAGGHSLIAIRMLSRIHKELGVRFQLTTIFDAPTIAALAAEVLKVRPGLDDELAGAVRCRSPRAVDDSAERRLPHRSLVPISTDG